MFNQKLLRFRFNEYQEKIENSVKMNGDEELDSVKSMGVAEKKRKCQK